MPESEHPAIQSGGSSVCWHMPACSILRQPNRALYHILKGSGTHRGCIFEHVCSCIAGLDVPRHINSASAFGRASGMQRGSDAITSERHDGIPRLASMSICVCKCQSNMRFLKLMAFNMLLTRGVQNLWRTRYLSAMSAHTSPVAMALHRDLFLVLVLTISLVISRMELDFETSIAIWAFS